MEIVEAKTGHLNEVYSLICELENESLNKDNFSRIYQDNIDNDNIYYLLAINESAIVGFASLHIQKLLHHCDKIGEIQEIVVLKGQQGLGIGTALFNRVVEIAVSNHCSQLEVCCNQARLKSHQFYLKQGMNKSHYKFTYPLSKK